MDIFKLGDKILALLEAVFGFWNNQISLVFAMLGQSPVSFKGGGPWAVIEGIEPVFVAVGSSLVVLFFVIGFCSESIDVKDEMRFESILRINYMVLRGKTEYKAELSTSPVGSMVKLENLFNGLHENIDFFEKKIEQYQNDLEASKAEYDKPFAYSEELEEKLARQCELNAQLDLENAKAMDADLGGPGEEREADDRVESAGIVAENRGTYTTDREGRIR